MIFKLKRNYLPEQTESLLEIKNLDRSLLFKCYILELKWNGNKNSISCIPEGFYPLTKEIQEHRGKVIRVNNVPNRQGILMHSGNFRTHTRGCLLPGTDMIDINADGLKDVINSKKTTDALYDILPDEDHNYLWIIS